jgi:hypothetical protein
MVSWGSAALAAGRLLTRPAPPLPRLLQSLHGPLLARALRGASAAGDLSTLDLTLRSAAFVEWGTFLLRLAPSCCACAWACFAPARRRCAPLNMRRLHTARALPLACAAGRAAAHPGSTPAAPAAGRRCADLFAGMAGRPAARRQLLGALSALWALPGQAALERYESLGKPGAAADAAELQVGGGCAAAGAAGGGRVCVGCGAGGVCVWAGGAADCQWRCGRRGGLLG